MHAHLLIDAVVQQTMVFIAQLATTGGVRTPLARVADQVFVELTTELSNQGVTKKVIADMFGMALRTYHRKVQETRESHTVSGRTVWEAVYDYVKVHEPVSGSQVLGRFGRDDSEVVSGVLSDLVNTGLAFRSGRGEGAVYRCASEEDFAVSASGDPDAREWLIWLTVYRAGKVSRHELPSLTRLPVSTCTELTDSLVRAGRLTVHPGAEGAPETLTSAKFETPLGSAQGWEVAVLDHFQAMITAVTRKLSGQGATSHQLDKTGGSTWSYDLSPDHPLGEEARSTLGRLRGELEDLRRRVDEYNAQRKGDAPRNQERVVVYVGQYVQSQGDTE